MKLREFLNEKMGMVGASLKLNKAEATGQKFFAFMKTYIDELDKEISAQEGRTAQVKGQKVKLKEIEREFNKIISNLRRFAQRLE